MKSFSKTITRMIKSNASRFIAMLLIIAVGAAFVTGVGGITSKIRDSVNEYYINTNAADLIIKSTKETGIDSNIISSLESKNLEYNKICQIDIPDTKTRLVNYDFDSKINELTIIDGVMPSNINECVIQEESTDIIKRNIGDTLTVLGNEYKIVGIVSNPLYLSKKSDEHTQTKENIDTIIYIDSEPILVTDLYVITPNNDYFKIKYKNEIKDLQKVLEAVSNDIVVLTLYENRGFALIDSLTDKIDIIAIVFPIFFILVVSLVTLTNMSRLVDDERKSIGCLKSLGYSRRAIVLKYLIFALISTLLGEAIGIIAGIYTLPIIVYPAFSGIFNMPDMTSKITCVTGLISSAFMLIAVLLVTLYVSLKTTNEKTSNLFLNKAPKPGKKILLEKTHLWNKLKFKFKSSIRNIFRFKTRFYMTVISVLGSTVLVMAGIGLLDSSKSDFTIDGITFDIGNTITLIAFAVVIFALLLSILVLYNLASMDIGERKREIATLKVLGYNKKEVNGFIFREIFIMALIGIILGIPLGTLFLFIIFKMLDFGGISDVAHYAYISAFLVSVIFVLIVILLLKSKINKVDMNDSLKSIE